VQLARVRDKQTINLHQHIDQEVPASALTLDSNRSAVGTWHADVKIAVAG